MHAEMLWLLFVGVPVGVLVLMVMLAGGKGRSKAGPWHTRAVCECGWHAECPFGDTFHVHREVCPECGAGKRYWVVKVMRYDGLNGEWQTRDAARPPAAQGDE